MRNGALWRWCYYLIHLEGHGGLTYIVLFVEWPGCRLPAWPWLSVLACVPVTRWVMDDDVWWTQIDTAQDTGQADHSNQHPQHSVGLYKTCPHPHHHPLSGQCDLTSIPVSNLPRNRCQTSWMYIDPIEIHQAFEVLNYYEANLFKTLFTVVRMCFGVIVMANCNSMNQPIRRQIIIL